MLADFLGGLLNTPEGLCLEAAAEGEAGGLGLAASSPGVCCLDFKAPPDAFSRDGGIIGGGLLARLRVLLERVGGRLFLSASTPAIVWSSSSSAPTKSNWDWGRHSAGVSALGIDGRQHM